MLKKIRAMIHLFELDNVKEAFNDLGIKEMTVSKVQELAVQKGQPMFFRGKKQTSDFQPEIRFEVVVEQEMAEKVIAIIQMADSRRKVGDGKIFIQPIETSVRIEPALAGATLV
ncbi:MAG: P-II family nitrogen regulator [Deltaproteobacteria bacterium]|nr:P-II family nitrogen regulator [Deltaproteobacteria bacterium]